jgi:ABC-2 type transport system permease protein
MIRLIKTEILKLRTIRVPYALLAGTAALTALITVLIASRGGHAALHGEILPPLNTIQGLTRVVTATRFGMLFATVLGVIISSGEFRHATATPTYLATPHREPVMIAKIIAAGLFGLAFGLVASGVATTVGLSFVAAKGFSVALTTSTVLRYAAGAAVASSLLCAAGAAIGTLVRQQVFAVVGVFAWSFVIEEILSGVFPNQARYFPFTAAISMSGRSSTDALPFWGAFALLFGVIALFATAASRTTLKRDIA